MLLAKLQDHWTFVFLKMILKVFIVHRHSGHLGHGT